MSATTDITLANPDQFIADLQRQLAECKVERDEALEQQTATTEVLQVINSSTGDLASVFSAILERATRLCKADFGIFLTYDGERFHTVALHNVPEPYAQFMERNPPQPGPDSAIGRILRGECVVRIDDVTQDRAFFLGDLRRRAIAELGRARSYVAVGLHQCQKLLGNSRRLSPGSEAVHRQADCASSEFCCASSDRNGKCGASDRYARRVGTAECGGGGSADHQKLGWRSIADLRGDTRQGATGLRGGFRHFLEL